MNKIILLDSNSLLHRAYYALASSNLTDSKGNSTGAIYGFCSMLARLIQEEKPTHVVAAFDLKGPTFRHKIFNAYKGTRKPMPEDLVPQVDTLKKLLKAFGIKIIELDGYEADDIIGTVAKKFKENTIIVTGDRDSFQLIDDSTTVYYTKRGITEVIRYDEARLLEDGFTPEMVVDYKALRGDSADNIPGIPGIGDKTAMELLAKYNTLDGVLSAEDIVGKLKDKIQFGIESAKMSYVLATIDTNAPIDVTLQDIAFKYPLDEKAKNALTELEFFSLIKRFEFEKSDINQTLITKKEISSIEIDDIDSLKIIVNQNVGKAFALNINDDVTIAFTSDTQYKVRINYDLFGGTSLQKVIETIQPLLVSNSDKIILNYKKLLHLLCEYNVVLNGNIYDVFLMGYLVFGGKTFTDVGSLNAAFGIEGDDIANLLQSIEIIKKNLSDKGLDNLYYDIELPLETVLFNMEKEGIKVNRAVLNDFKTKYENEIESVSNEIYRYADVKFNINSPKQLKAILFDKLGLISRKKNKTGLSVNIDVLNNLYNEHPIIPLIIRYRTFSKLLSTYIYGLEKAIAPDGRIHTDYRQTVTNTGRLSSTEPNLQNIPTRTSEGKEIRKAFVADEGNILISADYSQIELRLMAHMSGDENLIRSYNESRDIHTATAAEIYGINTADVTDEMRRNAKAVNFGIIYGISDFGLANNLSIRPKEAKKYIDKYFENYPKVKEFMEGLVAFAKENGYVKTLFGRIRLIPEINATNHTVREFGKRAAMNFPLQGTAADIIKIAMIEVDEKLKSSSAKMLLQVHDELIIEADEKEGDTIEKILVSSMENAAQLSVPLTVSVGRGKSWYEA